MRGAAGKCLGDGSVTGLWTWSVGHSPLWPGGVCRGEQVLVKVGNCHFLDGGGDQALPAASGTPAGRAMPNAVSPCLWFYLPEGAGQGGLEGSLWGQVGQWPGLDCQAVWLREDPSL